LGNALIEGESTFEFVVTAGPIAATSSTVAFCGFWLPAEVAGEGGPLEESVFDIWPAAKVLEAAIFLRN
jgi:hypothetical protein